MDDGTVLVTGGARRLGAAIARGLAAGGWRVVIHYNGSGPEAEALAAELGGAAVSADLADDDAVARLIDDARQRIGGPIHALVNSASLFEFDRPPAVDSALIDRLARVNHAAPVRLACSLASQPDVTRGVVVNLLDQKVANLNPDFFSYTCAKLALAGATRMLAQALAPKIRVNAVSPGLTLASGDQTEREFVSASVKNLLRRPVGADAVAGAVKFLLEAQGVTGQNLFVDCGQRFLSRAGDVMFEEREVADG